MKDNWLLVFSAICFAIFGITHLVGCNAEDMKKAGMEYDINTMSTEMHYYKDTNTNLCFAAMHIGMNSATMTNVPCTPEVEKIAYPFISDK